jgi:hypothetical protein
MNKIIEIHGQRDTHLSSNITESFKIEADSDLVCQPGVGWMEINETLQKKGKTAMRISSRYSHPWKAYHYSFPYVWTSALYRYLTIFT